MFRSICRHFLPAMLAAAGVAAEARPGDDIRFLRLSVEQGLSQSAVNAILQDRDGFMWFGTQDGLNRYDGYTFTIYEHMTGDSLSLSDNWVSCLTEDRSGILWVGTYSGGLNRYDAQRNGFTSFRRSADSSGGISGNNITGIVDGMQEDLWVGVWGGGLNRYDRRRGTWEQFRHVEGDENSLCSDQVRCLLASRDGALWIGTWNGLDRFDPATRHFQHFSSRAPAGAGPSDGRIVSLFEDRDTMLWVSTYANGLDGYDRRRGTFHPHPGVSTPPLGPGTPFIGPVVQDADGALWIGTRGGGLLRYDKSKQEFRVLRRADNDLTSLGADIIFALHCDRQGGIWVGTDGAGLSHYDARRYKFRHHRHSAEPGRGLSHPMVRAVCEEASGNVWIGTLGGGLNLFERATGTYRSFRALSRRPDRLSSDAVLAVSEDSRGRIWVGTDGGGLNLLDARHGSFRQYRTRQRDPSSLSSDYVMTIHPSPGGSLWIGTAGGGLNNMDPETGRCVRYVRTAEMPGALSGNYVWSIEESRDGSVWVGTWGAGLNRLDTRTGKCEVFRHVPGDTATLGHPTVFSLFEDRDGVLWIGTGGGGLGRRDPSTGRFTHVTVRQGLANNVVYGILEDEERNLWLSTDRGISRYTPRTGRCVSYDLGDGLQSTEFNQGAYFRGRSGRMYFGGINGLNEFMPGAVPANTSVPPVFITGFRVFDRPVPFVLARHGGDVIELSYSENFFSFEFVALDYTAPEHNGYSYRLEGVDRDWVQSGSRRFAAYTNLDGGEYVFRVRGSNSDGIWNEEGAHVRIRVASPYWERAWFRALLGLAVLAAAAMLYHTRVGRLKRERKVQQEYSRQFNDFQERERKRIAGALHDSLGQDLLVLKAGLDHCRTLASGQPELAQELLQLKEAAQQAVEEVREIAYDLHPHVLDRFGLTMALNSMVKKCGQMSPIVFTAEIENLDREVGPTERINLFRIVQEALNNVVRHSEATSCTVILRRADRGAEVVVRDNGKGFDPAPLAGAHEGRHGFGLSGIAERVRLLNGRMDLRTTPGGGTEIAVRAPLTERDQHS